MPAPVDRRPADESTLTVGTVLGSVEGHFVADKAHEYLEQIGETLPLYEKERVAHPGWLLLSANTVLSGTVRLGPWIHVSSAASMYRPVTDGQFVSTRARVTGLFERKGHRFVQFDVHVMADGDLAMAVDHTAIYKVREPQ